MLPNTSNLIANRYEILSRLGHGGMGVVDEAHDRLTGTRVALKRVPMEIAIAMMARTGTGHSPGSTDRRQARSALATEFHTLAALRHPNIISVLDYGFDRERTPFFTMELLQAPRTFVEAGINRSREEQLDLLVQLLRALTYLHRHRIIHRDLKPRNDAVSRAGPAPFRSRLQRRRPAARRPLSPRARNRSLAAPRAGYHSQRSLRRVLRTSGDDFLPPGMTNFFSSSMILTCMLPSASSGFFTSTSPSGTQSESPCVPAGAQ